MVFDNVYFTNIFFAFAIAVFGVQRYQADRIGIPPESVKLIHIHIQLFSDFLFCGFAAKMYLERMCGFCQLVGTGTHQARHPIHTAKLIKNGTSYTRGAVCLELHTSLRVESIYGVYQSENTGTDKVVQLNLVRQFAVQPLGAISYQASVMFHEQVAEIIIAAFVELLPYLVNAEFLLGFHRIPP